ncbi:PKHD-type hydroxylase [Arenicella chitinivorans]|uniref:PKHD-type hydroxylase n=1 Tax=Arenicella chitinivorans TaxID=1329800 RepID=A0A918VI30_9GAMM|nr:Fe2+-dependent dioxygenase [Arenicella chitinivorans]GGZ97925.1 PKHD-type hydroxylase [Arenicella chitinivorans]
MAFLIENAIDNHSLLAIQDAVADSSLYQDGKLTAGKSARQVKQNLQADPEAAAILGVKQKIETALASHPLLKRAVYPQRFAKIIISRYQPGMEYGAHIDEACIDNTRTDIAFTLFLSDPDTYSGGELEIHKSDGIEQIKLPAGSAYVYSADTIHRVTPVTAGERFAAIGWIQSKIRLAAHRQTLFDLSQALELLPRNEQNTAARLNILKVKSNLERLWCD